MFFITDDFVLSLLSTKSLDRFDTPIAFIIFFRIND